jgi:deazaflavin-dependent oxidoreductase (nitroreductase family)
MASANEWNAKIIAEFRANEGRVGGQFEGAPILLLTTKGAKSGLPRTSPMMYLPDGDRVLVFASYAGAPSNPDWYRNLSVNPDVTVEVGTQTYAATAQDVTGPERDALYAKQAALYPGFADYERKTTRVIPVVALNRS